MRINIEWVAPWRYGGPIKNYLWHTIRGKDIAGFWLLGFCCAATNGATSHGFSFGVML